MYKWSFLMDVQNAGQDFHRGEETYQELSPSDAVAQFIANRSKGVIGEVEATVILANGLKSYKGDAAKLKLFLEGLLDKKVVSKAEVEALSENKAAARVSKLTKIAEYRDRLLHADIRPWLSPGYSCLYEFVLLVEEIEKGQQGLDRVVEILSTCDGEISRAWLISERKKLRTKLGLGDEPENSSVADIDEEDAPSIQFDGTDGFGIDASKREALGVHTVKALLITPTDEQADRFKRELADGTKSPCVKVSGELDSNAVLLIEAKTSTILSMSTIIASLGFNQCVQVALRASAGGHDITSDQAMAVYLRGDIELPKFSDWHNDGGAAALALQMIEGVSGRLVHLFAVDAADGWESFISNGNWSQ